MTTDTGLSSSVLEDIINILKKNRNITKAILYGSRAKGTYKNGSDIDITLQGNITMEDLYKTEEDLEDLMLPYKIDLSIFNKIDHRELIDHIERIGITIYKK